jgi:membrane peptidoglycan carboxypeptidase
MKKHVYNSYLKLVKSCLFLAEPCLDSQRTKRVIENVSTAFKIGTTDEGKDIWFVGIRPRLQRAIWVGYDTPKAMQQAFGSMYPARIWQERKEDKINPCRPRQKMLFFI